MLNLMTLLLIVGLGASANIPPLTKINGDSLFGIHQSMTTDSLLESKIVNKVIEIRFEEEHTKFSNFCQIENRYTFKDLPFLRFYWIASGEPSSVKPNFPYNFILFNTIDSSIYHFGGNVLAFSNVVKPGLPYIVKENNYIDLIKLYLNTFSSFYNYHILDSIGTYEEIWRNSMRYYRADSPVKKYFTPKFIKNDINTVKGAMKSPEIQKNASEIILKIYSWENEYGKLEYWEFSISEKNFKLINRVTINKSLGPCVINYPYD